MGALLTRIRLREELRSASLRTTLDARTGLNWSIADETLPDGTRQLVFLVPSLQWEVRVTRNKQLGAYEVECVPCGMWSINYEFWQVVTALAKLGGVHVSKNGDESEICPPRWVGSQWKDLSWWARVRSTGSPQ